jgi:hypothetical protein
MTGYRADNLDSNTMERAGNSKRDLHRMGEYFLDKYDEMIRSANMENIAECGELSFRWETDFEYDSLDGWIANQNGTETERNLLMIIPGKNRK